MNVAQIREIRQLENAAFRQAGQAVAAAELRVPFEAVELTAADGRVVDLCQDRSDNAVLVWLAGVLAEEKLSGRPSIGGHVAEVCKRASRDAGHLVERCLAWIDNPQPWGAICQVAAELLERRRMTAAAVQSHVLAADEL
jgi:hypothetical protein